MLNLIQILAMRLRAREEGQTFVEYALLLGGVSLALLLVFGGLGDALGTLVDNIADRIDNNTA